MAYKNIFVFSFFLTFTVFNSSFAEVTITLTEKDGWYLYENLTNPSDERFEADVNCNKERIISIPFQEEAFKWSCTVLTITPGLRKKTYRELGVDKSYLVYQGLQKIEAVDSEGDLIKHADVQCQPHFYESPRKPYATCVLHDHKFTPISKMEGEGEK